ncbi:MAG: hypothetical protein PUA74_00300 [Clostridiales bacterium]|nr:hypothetical protein [Clostridiales bacterium]
MKHRKNIYGWRTPVRQPFWLSTKDTTTVNVHKTLTRFFFDEAGAKKKLGKKKAP